jgi:dihydrofolate synthase / folylpolyglutamate synthase
VSRYAETIAYLQGLEVAKGWDFRLDRIQAALELRGRPERRFRALHVAGTNGKGSTAAMLEAVLRAGGWRTGLYTSPHLRDFAERMRAGGLAIPHEAMVDLVDELRDALGRAAIDLTQFELTTLVVFEWFAQIGVEIAVVEVGLGGRLDATNVIEPLVAGITSIGRDHEAFLGRDLAGIAREKAGVAKPGVPLVVGPVAPDIEAVIAAVAREVGAPLVAIRHASTLDAGPDGLTYRGPGVAWDGIRLSLDGAFQRDNARTALTMLALVRDTVRIGIEAIREGLAMTWWPGRLARIVGAPEVVVDGAHNPDGVAALARELPRLRRGRPTTLVFAAMADKEWRAMLETLVPHVTRVVATRVGRRGCDPAEIARAFVGRIPIEVVEPATAAVAHARATSTPADMVLVAGSLVLAGDAYAAIDGDLPLVAPWQGWGRIGRQARP